MRYDEYGTDYESREQHHNAIITRDDFMDSAMGVEGTSMIELIPRCYICITFMGTITV